VETWAISAVVVMVLVLAERKETTRSTAEVHGVAACCYVLDAFGVDGDGEDDGCCRSVPGHFVGLVCDVSDEAALGSEYLLHQYGADDTYRAPRFTNLSVNEMAFATVTPSTSEC
jgi:hypothetical protein